jgi:hypothetical protein
MAVETSGGQGSVRPETAADGSPNRAMVTASITYATIMQGVDTTMARAEPLHVIHTENIRRARRVK